VDRSKTRHDETHISTFEAQAREQARVPLTHGIGKRPTRTSRTPRTWP
jgi:hypothetical protein